MYTRLEEVDKGEAPEMTEETDPRNEVFISRRKVDSTSGYIIEQTDISLKSKEMGIDALLEKAKGAMKG